MPEMTPNEKLLGLIRFFERHMTASPEKATKEMRWFTTQARAYLEGEFETIDQALGLEE